MDQFTGGDFVSYEHKVLAAHATFYLVTQVFRLLGTLGHFNETFFPIRNARKGWIAPLWK